MASRRLGASDTRGGGGPTSSGDRPPTLVDAPASGDASRHDHEFGDTVRAMAFDDPSDDSTMPRNGMPADGKPGAAMSDNAMSFGTPTPSDEVAPFYDMTPAGDSDWPDDLDSSASPRSLGSPRSDDLDWPDDLGTTDSQRSPSRISAQDLDWPDDSTSTTSRRSPNATPPQDLDWPDDSASSGPAERSAPLGSPDHDPSGVGGSTGGTESSVGAGRSDQAEPSGGAGRGSGGRGGRTGRRGGRQRKPKRADEATDLSTLSHDEAVSAARTIVLRQLAGQPRTKAELARTLRRKGVPDAAADHVLGRLSEVGLIDDAAFAHAWVESRHAGRGLARKALAHELQRRGVDRKDIEAAVEQLPPEAELATARKLVARKLRSTRRLEPDVRLRRLVGMLARKGYSSGIAFRAVREELAGEGADTFPDGLTEALESEPPEPDPF